MSDRGLTQDILLRIKAQNTTAADMKAATDAVNALTSAIDKNAEAARKGELSEAGLKNEIKNLNDAARSLTGITSLIDSYKNFSQQVETNTKKLEDQNKKLAEHQAAMAASGKKTGDQAKELKSLETGLAAINKSLEASRKGFKDTSDQLKTAGVDVNNLAQAERLLLQTVEGALGGVATLNTALKNYSANRREATEADKAAKIAAEQLAAAERLLADNTAKARSEYQARSQAVIQAAVKEQEALRAATVAHEKLTSANTERAKAQQQQRVGGVVGAAVQGQQTDYEARIKAEKDVAAERLRIRIAADEINRKLALAQIQAELKARQDAIEKEKAQRVAAAKAATAAEEAARKEDLARWDKYAAERVKRQVTAAEAERRVPLPLEGRRTDAKGKVGAGESQTPGFLGLRPYELTNLGYQLNDIIGGGLQGQHPIQILAQQGPQVVQILGSRLLPLLPLITAGVVALGSAFAILSRSMREASSQREFNAAITANATSIGYNAEALTKLRKEIKDLGVSWDDAGKLIRQSIDANLRPDKIKTFAEAAQHIADVTPGKSVTDAMADLIKGLTGGEQAIHRLINQYQVLTPEEIKHVDALLKANKTVEAQIYVLDKLNAAYKKASNEGLSDLSKATRTMSKAWDDMWIAFTNKDFGQLVEYYATGVVKGINKILTALKEGSTVAQQGWKDLFGPAGTGDYPNGTGTTARALIPPAPGGTRSDSSTGEGAARSATRTANEATVRSFLESKGYSPNAIAAIMGNISVESSFNPGIRNATGHLGLIQWDQPRQAKFGSSTDIQTQLNALDREIGERDPAFRTATDAVDKLALRFENKIEVSGGQLNSKRVAEAQRYAAQGDSLTTGPTTTQITTGADAVRDEQERLRLAHARSELEELEITRAQARREIEEKTSDKAQQDAYVQAKVEEVRKRQVAERIALESRDSKQKTDDARHLAEIQAAGEKAVAEARKRGLDGYKELDTIRQQGMANERDRLARLDAETDRLNAFTKLVEGLGSDKKNVTELDKALKIIEDKYKNIYIQRKKLIEESTPATRTQLEATTPDIEQKKQEELGEARLTAAQTTANLAVQQRTRLIQTYNDLYEAGAISQTEKEKSIKDAYGLTTKAINDAADAIQKIIDTSNDISPERLAELTAEVKKLRAEAIYTDPYLKELRRTFIDSLSSNASKAFDTVAEALGGVIAKTKNWKDVFVSLKTAAADFFAGVLKDMAKFILEAQMKKALSGLIPGAGDGSSGGLFGSLFGSAAGGASSAAGFTGSINDFGGGSALAAVVHGGGVVGSSALPARSVDGFWFKNAPRFHAGTMVGLRSDEQAAILQRGEEVLANDNPRNMKNWAGQQQSRPQDVNIRNVLVADPELVPSHMGSARGEKVIMNVLKRNSATVRQLVS